MTTIEQTAREILLESASITKPKSYVQTIQKLGTDMYHDTMGGGSAHVYGPSEVHRIVGHIYGVSPKIVHMHTKEHHDKLVADERKRQEPNRRKDLADWGDKK